MSYVDLSQSYFSVAGLPPYKLSEELRREWLCLAALITFAFSALPYWTVSLTWHYIAHTSTEFSQVNLDNYYRFVGLLFGLLLASSNPRRSGLCLGNIRANLCPIVLICAASISLTALVYPHLEVRPFKDAEIGMWLLSPLAQDLVFCGYLYGRFEILFPDYIHPHIRVRQGLLITALFFSAYHLPNFLVMPAGYVCFQLVYVFLGFSFFGGLTRQWTGSILPYTILHTLVNWIAYETS